MATKTTPATKAKLYELVATFNAAFPVGTSVWLREDNGSERATFVRASAKVLAGNAAVAFFSGVNGAYSIWRDRVRKREGS